MGIIKSLFNRAFRQEYSTEISMRINSEQDEYENMYNSIFKDKDCSSNTKDNSSKDEFNAKKHKLCTYENEILSSRLFTIEEDDYED